MSKLRTVNDLQDLLDMEFAWRLKEIADMKRAVRGSTGLSQDTLIRAGIPLFYAHWEGFVKATAEAYIRFVSLQRLRYSELTSAFVVFGVKRHLQSLAESRKAKVNIAAADFFATKFSERAQLSFASAIDTEANLSSGVFENIVLSVGISPTAYEARYNFIDTRLLDRRNRIAHGEYLDLDATSFRDLADGVIALLRDFKTDVETAASSGSYKR
jgi:hypothetical protein